MTLKKTIFSSVFNLYKIIANFLPEPIRLVLHEEALIKGSQILNVVLIANHLSDIRLRLGEEGVWSLQLIFNAICTSWI